MKKAKPARSSKPARGPRRAGARTPSGVARVRALEAELKRTKGALRQSLRREASTAEILKRLSNEKNEALERQTATAEILKVIASSPSDVQPVLDAVAASGARLCDASDAIIVLREGEFSRFAAHYGSIPNLSVGGTRPITRDTVNGRAMLEGRQFHIADLQSESAEFPDGSKYAREYGYRTIFVTPLMREGAAIGAIMIRRTESRPFSDQQVQLVRTFADQAVIAIENARLFNDVQARTQELTESLEQQTATSEVLSVISRSTTNLQPVLDSIVATAARLCQSEWAVIHRLRADGKNHAAAFSGANEVASEWLLRNPIPLVRGAVTGRAMLDKRTTHIPDVLADPEYAWSESQRLMGYRTMLAVPLLREGHALGTITMLRTEVKPFTEKQIELITTFADQAVIAIENVRLFNETKEALERQTATAEILKVIASSPSDVQPVFDAIARSATRLVGGFSTVVARLEGEVLQLAALTSTSNAGDDAVRRSFPLPLGNALHLATAIQAKEPRWIVDIEAEAESPVKATARARGWRSAIAVPMLRGAAAVGVINVTRAAPGPFTDHEVGLLKTFADQAVIAIENVRLFNETREALERQTATAEILKVIASSPSDVQPVFDAIVQSAVRLFDPCNAGLWMVEGDQLFHCALAKSEKAPTPIDTEALARLFPRPLESSYTFGIAIAKKRVVEMQETEVPGAPADALEISRALGTRSVVFVPLLREGTAIGLIGLASPYPGMKLAPEQITLLRTFADQAVIAIENVRLFNETRESLERQTATAEILKVIASSPSDVQPVFDAIVNSVSRLFGRKAALRTVEAEGLRRRARSYEPTPSEFHGPDVEPLDQRSIVGQAILGGRARQWADTRVEGAATYGMEKAESLAFRSIASAPLIRDGKAIGVISVSSPQPGTLSDKQMELLSTFADQAVIAIENVRLFNETKEALERQTATAEILKVIAASPSDVQPVFDTVARKSVDLCGGSFGVVTRFDGELVHVAAISATASSLAEDRIRAAFPAPPSNRGAASRSILTRQIVHMPDVTADVEYTPDGIAKTGGIRSILAVPLIRGGEPLGSVSVARTHAAAFTPHQIALLKTFADQAVIAIENVRLFNETKESLERQTATAEILKVIASSPSDVQPVFDAIAASARRLLGGDAALVARHAGDTLELAAFTSVGEAADAALRQLFPSRITGKGHMGKALLSAAPVLIEDIETDPGYSEEFRASARTRNVRSIVSVPMLREGEAIGVISVNRSIPGRFSDHQTNLLKTFADQAVIAIENVRLFNETQEALARQAAAAQVLRSISESVSDTAPVFTAILDCCNRLIPSIDYVQVELIEGSDQVRLVDHRFGQVRGAAPGKQEERRAELMAREAAHFPRPLAGSTLERALNQGRVVILADTLDGPDTPPATLVEARRWGHSYSQITVPLMSEGRCIGAIEGFRRQLGGFEPKESSLLESFADQAVVAIQNARLFNETKEALERQTATAEILKVISSSPTDVQPVFDTIVDSAMRLLGGATAHMTRLEEGVLHLVAFSRTDAAGAAALNQMYPLVVAGTVAAEVLEQRTALVVADMETDSRLADSVRAAARARSVRSFVLVPLVSKGVSVGTLVVNRRETGNFSAHEIGLLRTFADQAVIAIENVRLFNETKEALERQTATAEILKVISSSPTDVEPVFTAIVRKAVQLSGASRGALYRLEGEVLDLVAHHNQGPEALRALQRVYPMKPNRTQASGRAVLSRAVVEIPDVKNDPEYLPGMAAQADLGSLLAVPMLRGDGAPSGVIVIQRSETGVFALRHVELLKTFADQAVIAIENVRLFKELQSRTEALTKSVGQLTALGEVGQAISSTLELDKVLQTIVQHAVQLTGLDAGAIYEYDEGSEQFTLQTAQNMDPALVEGVRRTPIRKGDGATGRIAVTLGPMQVADVEDGSYHGTRKDVLVRAGYRAVLAVPLLSEGRLLGALQVFRKSPGLFADEIVELMKTFATQSAMAIQNARLFREIEEKGKQLEEASKHKSQFLASMSHELRTPLNAILGFNEMILGDVYGEVPVDMKEPLSDIQTSGKHLLRLINNVLDLAKIEAGRMELAVDDYSVHDTVESVRSTLRPLAEAKGLELAVEVPPDIPLARGDGGRITQCLMNLAGNSLKFTKQGSVGISVVLTNATLTYKVQDTGIGIPADKIGSLFTEFKQTDATIASEYGGTGLGLSITKKFIEMHGGRIWAESEPGSGSTFIFEIPLRASEERGA